MEQLAIKGHATRGKEVIEILEMLGGKTSYECSYKDGFDSSYFFFINTDENFSIDGLAYNNEELKNYYIFTLEEFLEKFPYKVGDKVSSKYLKNYKIEKMEWEDTNNRVIYKLQGMGWYSVRELQPYKEEDMETITIDDFKANTKEWLIDKLGNMSIDNTLQTISNIYDELHKSQYPKTYKECCKVLGYSGNYNMILTTDIDNKLFNALYRLKVCRDAYWKIVGKQMGLKEPWKPDWLNVEQDKYVIFTDNNTICSNCYVLGHNIFAFPTKEMRDVFYENFKELIEETKELL